MANPVDLGFDGHEWSNPLIENELVRRGGFVSEYTDQAELFSEVFLERLLQRDRIISGLCDIFLAFECRENSATVDTAKRAILQGKRVICIDSGRRTARVGLYQLAEEHNLPLVSVEAMTSSEITSLILDGTRTKM